MELYRQTVPASPQSYDRRQHIPQPRFVEVHRGYALLSPSYGVTTSLFSKDVDTRRRQRRREVKRVRRDIDDDDKEICFGMTTTKAFRPRPIGRPSSTPFDVEDDKENRDANHNCCRRTPGDGGERRTKQDAASTSGTGNDASITRFIGAERLRRRQHLPQSYRHDEKSFGREECGRLFEHELPTDVSSTATSRMYGLPADGTSVWPAAAAASSDITVNETVPRTRRRQIIANDDVNSNSVFAEDVRERSPSLENLSLISRASDDRDEGFHEQISSGNLLGAFHSTFNYPLHSTLLSVTTLRPLTVVDEAAAAASPEKLSPLLRNRPQKAMKTIGSEMNSNDRSTFTQEFRPPTVSCSTCPVAYSCQPKACTSLRNPITAVMRPGQVIGSGDSKPRRDRLLSPIIFCHEAKSETTLKRQTALARMDPMAVGNQCKRQQSLRRMINYRNVPSMKSAQSRRRTHRNWTAANASFEATQGSLGDLITDLKTSPSQFDEAISTLRSGNDMDALGEPQCRSSSVVKALKYRKKDLAEVRLRKVVAVAKSLPGRRLRQRQLRRSQCDLCRRAPEQRKLKLDDDAGKHERRFEHNEVERSPLRDQTPRRTNFCLPLVCGGGVSARGRGPTATSDDRTGTSARGDEPAATGNDAVKSSTTAAGLHRHRTPLGRRLLHGETPVIVRRTTACVGAGVWYRAVAGDIQLTQLGNV